MFVKLGNLQSVGICLFAGHRISCFRRTLLSFFTGYSHVFRRTSPYHVKPWVNSKCRTELYHNFAKQVPHVLVRLLRVMCMFFNKFCKSTHIQSLSNQRRTPYESQLSWAIDGDCLGADQCGHRLNLASFSLLGSTCVGQM